MIKKNQSKKVNIQIDKKVAEGSYCNLAIINHSVSEFVIDFVNLMPGSPEARVKSRIILTPEHAKRFQKALDENIKRFEKTRGDIKINDTPSIPLSFGTQGEA